MSLVIKTLFFICLTSTSFVCVSMAQSTCPVEPLSISEFQPEKLGRWIEKNKSQLGSAKDFLCCVPEHVRNRFVIAHSSLAAQNGNAKNPRVIFFHKSVQDSINPDDNRLHFAFSLNSGRSHLNNPNNVEFVYADQDTGELSYFDLEVSQDHKGFVGGKNPEKCMACHGTTRSSGAKPLFTDRPWHNFVSGNTFEVVRKGTALRCEPIPLEVTRELDLATLDALLGDLSDGNSNFSCMNRGSLTSARNSISSGEIPRDSKLLSNLIEFDNSLRHAHRHRIWQDIVSDPQYSKLKYLMLGATLCEDIRIRDWVPREILWKALGEVDFYNYKFARMSANSRFELPLGGVIMEAHNKTRRLIEEFDRRKENLFDLLSSRNDWEEFLENSDSKLHFGSNPLACYRGQAKDIVQRTFMTYNATRPILSRFELDNMLARESSNIGNHPLLRFVYEGLLSRPAIDLNMSLYAGVSANSLNFEKLPILSIEPTDSQLFDLFIEHDIRFGGLSNDFAMTIAQLRKEEIPFLIESSTWSGLRNSTRPQRVFSSTKPLPDLCESLKNNSNSALSSFSFEN